MVNKNTWKNYFFKDKNNFYNAQEYDEYAAKKQIAINILEQEQPDIYLDWLNTGIEHELFKTCIEDIEKDLKEISEKEYLIAQDDDNNNIY